MKKPLIFSGTTEGRQISERLSRAGIAHIVCVATGYGELVMQPSPYADVRQGRLTEPEMEKLIAKDAERVFDATHPYAAAVSENIREACDAVGAEYIRVLREDSGRPDELTGIRLFDDAASCAEALKETEGNILLTTGSRDLNIYADDDGVRNRLFARVLPSEESISLCGMAGLCGRQVIAMQGPFSREMDIAMIRQFNISVMVTKLSGRIGGFEEKLDAAAETGIPVFLIGRPSLESGISAAEALYKYFGLKPSIHIDLVGIGPGKESLMTAEARDAVRAADIICGAERMTAAYSGRETYPYYLARDIIPLISLRQPERMAVLFSGDTGFYSGAAKLKPALEKWLDENGYDHEIILHPGISSFAYLAAKAGIAYQGAALCSMHGKKDETNLQSIIETIVNNSRTFVLMSGPEDVQKLGLTMSQRGLGECIIILGKDLSYPSETISEITPPESFIICEKGLYIALVINNKPERRLTKVLADDDLIRGNVPMTKENIRHLSVLKLGLKEDAVVYDVGSGTGSVACETAMQSSSLKVYAIEMKKDACGLIRQNADKLGLSNITVIEGRAPDAFGGLEEPDCVFIGGSSGGLMDILKALSTAPDPVRIVINAVSLETMAEIQSVLKKFEISDLSVEQISVSRSRELGNHHLMTAENPVMIAAFTLRGLS